jgi:hypothetical protein
VNYIYIYKYFLFSLWLLLSIFLRNGSKWEMTSRKYSCVDLNTVFPPCNNDPHSAQNLKMAIILFFVGRGTPKGSGLLARAQPALPKSRVYTLCD